MGGLGDINGERKRKKRCLRKRFKERLKSCGFVFCEIRENLPIKLNIFILEGFNKRAVFHPLEPDSRVNLSSPKPAIIALFLFASLKRVRPRVNKSFMCRSYF